MSIANNAHALGRDLAMKVPAKDTDASVKANPSDNKKDAAGLKNEFITLMVAQIKNQDPLNPLDGAKYVSQLAQFSQVEGTENVANLMKNGLALQKNMQALNTAGLVGKHVYVPGKSVDIGDKVQKGKLELKHDTNNLVLNIQDDYGETKKLPLGQHSAGEVEFAIDPKKLGLQPGKYTLAADVKKGEEAPAVLLQGEVEQVRIPKTGGSPLVKLSGVGSVPFYKISQFGI